MNVTDALDFFAEDRIKVGKEEAGTITFNQVYDRFQANQDKYQTRKLMELARWKIHGQINQCQIIVIISIVIQNIPAQILEILLCWCQPSSLSLLDFFWMDQEDCDRC